MSIFSIPKVLPEQLEEAAEHNHQLLPGTRIQMRSSHEVVSSLFGEILDALLKETMNFERASAIYVSDRKRIQ